MIAAAQIRSGAMSNEDRIYFARRAAEEQDRAVASPDANVAEAHRKLQRAYLERASTGDRPSDQPEQVG
jgi:hypothetical protein